VFLCSVRVCLRARVFVFALVVLIVMRVLLCDFPANISGARVRVFGLVRFCIRMTLLGVLGCVLG